MNKPICQKCSTTLDEWDETFLCPACRASSAANEPDVTEDTVVPGRFRCAFEATYEVECEFDYEKGVSFALLHQAIQDALGYTGVVVDDVTEYEEIP